MPAPRKVDLLPEDVRRELEARLLAGAFAGYEALSEWLATRGYNISKSALHRHGEDLKAEYEGTMREVRTLAGIARELVDEDPDQQAALNDLAARLATDQLVRAARELRDTEGMELGERIHLLGKLAQPITQAQRAAVYSRRWSAEQRREAITQAAAAAETTARGQGVSPAGIEALRAAIMGAL